MADPSDPGPQGNEPGSSGAGGGAGEDVHERLAAHMSGRLESADHVERLDVLSADEHARIQGGLAEAMHDRLAALDLLYERGEITASELGAARQRILEATEAPTAGAAGAKGATEETIITPPPTAQPAAAAPPPQEPGPGGPPPSAGGPGDDKRILGMPRAVALGLLALVVVVIAVGVGLLVAQPWSSSDDAAPATTDQTAQGYLGQIEAPFGRLTDSAVSIGKTLARVSSPADLKQLGRNADRQLDVVENARKTLSNMTVAPEDQAAHDALLAASASQRRYLVTLSRTVSLPPDEGLALVPQVGTQADALDSRYDAFFALVPEAPDAITGSDLDDTAGLTAALTEAKAQAEALAEQEQEREQEPSTPATPATPGPGVYTGTAFSSPTGNLRCGAYGSTLRCSSANDGFSATLPEFGPPTTVGGPIEGGGQTVPYGADWVSGPFRCDSETDGITCRSTSSGNGFFLSRDAYTPF